jgi:CHASE2 domain-containing sensor protein
MWPARRRKSKKAAGDPRRKILLWAAVVGLFFGLANAGEPVENIMHVWRDRLHPTKASGQIVVIGIDDRSVEQLGRWPWQRRDLAKIIDNLDARGARRILLDINTYGVTNPVDDEALAKAIARVGSKMVLPTRFAVDPATGKRTLSMPLPEFRKTAKLGNINWKQNFGGEVWQMPYGLTAEGVHYDSMSSILGGTTGPTETWFPIDTSIRTSSIPQVSAVDIYTNSVAPSAVKGKDVIIALTSWQLNDTYQAPGQGLSPGVFSHVLAAETLKKGRNVDIRLLHRSYLFQAPNFENDEWRYCSLGPHHSAIFT